MGFGYVKCKVLHIMSLGQPWLASHLEGLGEATALLICALYQRSHPDLIANEVAQYVSAGRVETSRVYIRRAQQRAIWLNSKKTAHTFITIYNKLRTMPCRSCGSREERCHSEGSSQQTNPQRMNGRRQSLSVPWNIPAGSQRSCRTSRRPPAMKETLSTDIASQSLRMAMHLLLLSLRENRRFGSANAVALLPRRQNTGEA